MGKISLTSEQKQALEATGYGLSGDIGGLPRQTYYTPDGRVIQAIPSIRQFVRKDAQGKVIASGTRDANLDRGWLLQKPAVLKPHCPACDRWHDTRAEVQKCVRQQQAFIEAAQRRAEAEEAKLKAKAEAKTANLEKEVADLKAMVKKLMGGTDGIVFQQHNTQPNGQAARGNGRVKAAIQ